MLFSFTWRMTMWLTKRWGPSFVHVFWSSPELLILLLWVVIVWFLGCFSGDELFALFWQDLSPNIFKMETKGFWLLEVRLCNRFWGKQRKQEMENPASFSRWPETFTKRFYTSECFVLKLRSLSFLHKKKTQGSCLQSSICLHVQSQISCFPHLSLLLCYKRAVIRWKGYVTLVPPL